jgi:hypothetical protein
MLRVVMLSVVMLNVVVPFDKSYSYENHSAACHSVESHGADCSSELRGLYHKTYYVRNLKFPK